MGVFFAAHAYGFAGVDVEQAGFLDHSPAAFDQRYLTGNFVVESHV